VILASLDRYATRPSGTDRVFSALAPLGLALAAALLLGGVSLFLFGARRTLLDAGLWWRLGLALAGLVWLRSHATREGRVARAARAVEALLFLAAGAFALWQGFATLRQLAA